MEYLRWSGSWGQHLNPPRHQTDRQPDSALAGISRTTAESYPARFAFVSRRSFSTAAGGYNRLSY